MTGQTQAQAWITEILRTGGDPKAYRQGIAESSRIPVERVDDLITVAAKPAHIEHPEETAHRRMAEDARLRGTAAWRQANHEEE